MVRRMYRFPIFLARRYMSDSKIFDKLKQANELLLNKDEREKSTNEKEEEKIEIINIDDRVFDNTNVFKKDIEQEHEENATKREEEFYENIKSFKNLDIQSFIQETIDYYSSKQLKESHMATKEKKQNDFNEKEANTLNKFTFDDTDKDNEISYESNSVGSGKFYTNSKKDTCDNLKDRTNLIMDEFKYKTKENYEQVIIEGDTNSIYEGLTPAQRFYEENKEKLLYETMKYYNKRKEKLSNRNDDGADRDYYYIHESEPVVRPHENYLFDYENEENDNTDEEGLELEKGIMPTIEQVVCILKHEKVKNIKVIDLNKCGRRDIGMFIILCTGQTPKHNKRVGKLISKIFIDLEIPYISNVVYCYCNKFDDWIITHCGPLKIHIVTKELRDYYDIENLFLYPHEHFDSKNFPSFFDYTPGVPPPYIVRSNSSLDAYHNDDLYKKFISDR
ncbi:conserved Plasmodium protein, unknown function [Plasmodium malariae]|uniref:Ribosomal silencing factor RsfS n=2 Tax=Plasmodium malariae TaxID=5858 RepID=A0A1D3JJG4_PLAMA|nr:conserved Plasmodium protein, unknown function [Plasmodium malariae]SBT86634.1 conserved Plasmodium protein, unknown function [Plasmodium malariae]